MFSAMVATYPGQASTIACVFNAIRTFMRFTNTRFMLKKGQPNALTVITPTALRPTGNSRQKRGWLSVPGAIKIMSRNIDGFPTLYSTLITLNALHATALNLQRAWFFS